MNSTPEEDRTSIWSIGGRQHRYFVVISFVIFATIVVLRMADCWNCLLWEWSLFHKITALLTSAGIASVIITWAGFNGREAMGIALERYKQERFERGKAEARQEMIEELEKALSEDPDNSILKALLEKYRGELEAA